MSERPGDYEYDPAWQEANKETVQYQFERLGHAMDDLGNEIAKELLPVLLTSSSLIRAVFAQVHAAEVESWGWPRRLWHLTTGHRKP